MAEINKQKGTIMVGAETGTLKGKLSGTAFLDDFQVATRMAASVDTFESWVLAGEPRKDLIEQIKHDPLLADERLAIGGLAALLTSKEEKDRIQDLVEEARRLDISRFLGYKAIVTAHKRGSGSIRRAPVYMPNTGMIYGPGQRSRRKSVSAKLTSLSPATKSFRIGEYRSRLLHTTAFWEVSPFDKETGEPIVDLDLQWPREPLPSEDYQRWYAANHA
jgi:hypothetical protein